jgi:ribose 5-phosphate isomerase RpiB
LAECVARGDCQGGIVFCQDPGLVCCVSNKVAGLRAVVVSSAASAARAALSLAANFVAVEMPGRTFFELRQILRTLCTTDARACPAGVACTLQELDGHAHR